MTVLYRHLNFFTDFASDSATPSTKEHDTPTRSSVLTDVTHDVEPKSASSFSHEDASSGTYQPCKVLVFKLSHHVERLTFRLHI